MRPALKAGLLPVWRDRDTLQIGLDPRRAAALSGMRDAGTVVGLLDGSRDLTAVVRAAEESGVPAPAAHRVLGLLAATGTLTDSAARALGGFPPALRARLAPELATACIAYGDGDGGARTLARRRAALVRVHGTGRIGSGVATLLATAGIGHVVCADSGIAGPADLAPAGLGTADLDAPRAEGAARAIRRVAPDVRTDDDRRARPDLVVLAETRDRELGAALVRERIPHLAVDAAEAIGVVGPLVSPGQSACLRCLDLTRAERDPAWPLILAQVAGTRAIPRACDTVLAAAVAALAAAQALTFIDRPGQPAAANGTLELAMPDWRWRRRTWPPHPACTCGASQAPA